MLLGADGHPVTIVTVVRGAVWLACLIGILWLGRFALRRWGARAAR